MRLITILILFLICSFSCTDRTEKKVVSVIAENQKVKEVKVEKDTINEVTVFDHYNAVKQLAQDWNTAINDRNYDKLMSIYSEQPSVYLQEMTIEQCIKSKKDWLENHLNYSQTIKDLEVYFGGNEIQIPEEMTVECLKITMEHSQETTYHAILKFRWIAGQWKLYQETDWKTELKRAENYPSTSLSKGKYLFCKDYWMDSRGGNLAHDMIRFSTSYEFEVKEDSITGYYEYYSGAMRRITTSTIVNGLIEKGVLTLDMRLDLEDWEEDEPPHAIEKERFKIMENGLQSLNEDYPVFYRLCE